MQQENFIELTDSYKWSHHSMMAPGTVNSYGYFESRNGAKFDHTVFVGLQDYLIKYFAGVVVTQEMVEEADKFQQEHFMGHGKFDREMWEYIIKHYGGKLPLHIKAVPEGTPVPINNVLLTVELVEDNEMLAPLSNRVESLLTHIWHTCNIATMCCDMKQTLTSAYADTVDEDQHWLVDYALHDFGFRGASCLEAAKRGSMAHLVYFMGTDTPAGITYAQYYYNTKVMLGYSVNASEHMVQTAGGRINEFQVTQRIIRDYPGGILSIVSDSYDIEAAVKVYCSDLREDILNRDDGAKFVVRPDSPRFEDDTPYAQVLWIVEQLYLGFGGTVNSKGYKVLNPKVGVIYGDGIDADDVEDILNQLRSHGFAASNCMFGMGGGLHQKHNRDTQRNAFKCSARKIEGGEWVDVYKAPKDASKASKRGRLKLVKDADGSFETVGFDDPREDCLVTVFDTGVVVKKYTFEEVRENAKF